MDLPQVQRNSSSFSFLKTERPREECSVRKISAYVNASRNLRKQKRSEKCQLRNMPTQCSIRKMSAYVICQPQSKKTKHSEKCQLQKQLKQKYSDSTYCTLKIVCRLFKNIPKLTGRDRNSPKCGSDRWRPIKGKGFPTPPPFRFTLAKLCCLRPPRTKMRAIKTRPWVNCKEL